MCSRGRNGSNNVQICVASFIKALVCLKIMFVSPSRNLEFLGLRISALKIYLTDAIKVKGRSRITQDAICCIKCWVHQIGQRYLHKDQIEDQSGLHPVAVMLPIQRHLETSHTKMTSSSLVTPVRETHFNTA